MKNYRHNKTGNIYQVTNDNAINATNERDGEEVVVYKNPGGMVFVRNKDEFLKKFTEISTSL